MTVTGVNDDLTDGNQTTVVTVAVSYLHLEVHYAVMVALVIVVPTVDSVEEAWSWYARGFGPMKALIDTLSPDRLAAFKQEIDAYHAGYRTEAGLHLKREYLLIKVRRR